MPENCEFFLVKVYVVLFCFVCFSAFILIVREKDREEGKGRACDMFSPIVFLSSLLSTSKIASFLLGKGEMPSLHG